MPSQRGPWTVRGSSSRFQNEFLELFVDDVVRPDGKPDTYAWIELQSGVAILPLDEEGRVHLVRQHRYAIDRDSLEAPSGGIEPGQDARDAARMELRQELGLTASAWSELGRLEPDPSLVRGPVALFVARGLACEGADPDGTERLTPVAMPLADAVGRVVAGEIVHAPTCVLVLRAALDAGLLPAPEPTSVVQILLPVTDASGRHFDSSLYDTVAHELTARFGGLTAYMRAPATGLWREGGRTTLDEIVVVEVMVDALDRAWWARYRAELERRFAQAELVVRAQPMRRL